MVEIGHVHVVVDHDDILRRVGGGATLGGDMRDLHRMAGIALCDGYPVQHARAADLMAPHRVHAGNAGIGDVLLDRRRAHHGAITRHFVRPRAHRRHAQHDWIIPIIDRPYIEHWNLPHAAGVMPGPFAERALRMHAVGRHVAFEHDLGIGWKRQPGNLAAHHLDRAPAQAADKIEFEYAIWRFQPTEEERDRIAAEHHGHRQRLAPFERLVAMDAAMVARLHHDAHGFFVMHLRAIRAGVEPVFLRVAGDAVGAGADVAAAVLFVPLRRRKYGDVDAITHHDVLEHGSVVDHDVRHDALLL